MSDKDTTVPLEPQLLSIPTQVPTQTEQCQSVKQFQQNQVTENTEGTDYFIIMLFHLNDFHLFSLLIKKGYCILFNVSNPCKHFLCFDEHIYEPILAPSVLT